MTKDGCDLPAGARKPRLLATMPDASEYTPDPVPPPEIPVGRLNVGEWRNHPKVRQAYALAALAHDGQTYGKSGIPYIEHVCGVAETVYRVTMQHQRDITLDRLTDELCAALLHDTLEDKGHLVTPALLTARFGQRVSDIVSFCTDEHKVEDAMEKQEWWNRKQPYLAKLAYAGTSPEWRTRHEDLVSAATVCCADKLYNQRSSNKKLEYAIKHGSATNPLPHKFWAGFKQAQMWRARYDHMLALAFQTLDKELAATPHRRLSQLVDTLNREVDELRWMMTHLQAAKERPAVHQW